MNNTRNRNILDLILTNCSIISEVCISAPLGSSDHSSIDFKVTWNSANLGHSKSRYSFSRANYDAIRAKLSNFNWSDLLRDLSTEGLTESLHNYPSRMYREACSTDFKIQKEAAIMVQ